MGKNKLLKMTVEDDMIIDPDYVEDPRLEIMRQKARQDYFDRNGRYPEEDNVHNQVNI